MFAITLALLAPFAVQAQAAAQAADVPVLTIAVDGPLYAGQPAWVRAVSGPTRNVRYPFHASASDLGCNRLEVKRDGVLLTPAPMLGNMMLDGIMCGSAAPPGSPEQRLPLHILYPLTKPGKYAVRWTMENSNFSLVERPDFHPVQPLDSHPVQHPGLPGVQSAKKQGTIAQSDWLTFEVLPSTAEQREAWLKNLLATPPEDAGHLAGDFIPSLVAAATDQRALNMLVKYLHSPEQMVSGIASSALEAFPKEVVLRAVVETLVKDGPSDELAQFATMHRGWTPEDENRIVHAAIPYLLSMSAMQPVGRQRADLAQTQSAAALKLLGYMFYVPNHVWPESGDLRDYAEAEVMKAAAKIMSDGNAVTVQQLAIFLGEMKYSPQTHELLLQLAERPGTVGEQARIGLRWQAEAGAKK